MKNKIYYNCFLETKEGIKHCFYTTTNKNKDILNSVKDFDQGKYWSIDACNNEELITLYKEDPKDNSFVLIPKTSVLKVWNEIAKIKPKKISKSKIF